MSGLSQRKTRCKKLRLKRSLRTALEGVRDVPALRAHRPYANLSLALIVLLVKPQLLPLPSWDDLFPGMDWTQPEYFMRRPDQDHAYASVYVVLYGVFGVCAQYCSIAMGEKTRITYSVSGQQSNRGMKGAATVHKLIFGLYHLTLAALQLVVFSTAADTITGTVAERTSSARYTAAKVGAAALGALWLAMATLPMHEYQQGPQDVPRHGQLCVHVRHLHGLGAGAAGCHRHGHPRQRCRLRVLAAALHKVVRLQYAPRLSRAAAAPALQGSCSRQPAGGDAPPSEKLGVGGQKYVARSCLCVCVCVGGVWGWRVGRCVGNVRVERHSRR